MKQAVSNDIYLLLMRAAMGEQLDKEESALLRAFLDSRKKA